MLNWNKLHFIVFFADFSYASPSDFRSPFLWWLYKTGFLLIPHNTFGRSDGMHNIDCTCLPSWFTHTHTRQPRFPCVYFPLPLRCSLLPCFVCLPTICNEFGRVAQRNHLSISIPFLRRSGQCCINCMHSHLNYMFLPFINENKSKRIIQINLSFKISLSSIQWNSSFLFTLFAGRLSVSSPPPFNPQFFLTTLLKEFISLLFFLRLNSLALPIFATSLSFSKKNKLFVFLHIVHIAYLMMPCANANDANCSIGSCPPPCEFVFLPSSLSKPKEIWFSILLCSVSVLYETTLWLVLVDVDVDMPTTSPNYYAGLVCLVVMEEMEFQHEHYMNSTLLAPLSSLPLPSSVVPCRFLPFSPLSDRWCYFSTISTQYQLHLLTQPSSLQFSFSTCPYLLQNTTFF